jgi:uncharacterized membrane protein
MVSATPNWHAKHQKRLTRGQRIADTVAATIGSWTFIIIQSIILTIWILLNLVAWMEHWDPYPFILLNLALSFQAAYAAPFILISQNRQASATVTRRKRTSARMWKPSAASRICSARWPQSR